MTADTTAGTTVAPHGEWLPTLDLPEPGPQRRLTVFFRYLILIPQFIVLWVLSIAAAVVAFVGWFAALVLGRLPDPIAAFLCGYVGYETRVTSSLMLLVDRYPPFAMTAPRDHPVQVVLRPGRLNRLAVFFRVILMIPAVVVFGLASAGWFAVSFVLWLIVLIAGRMPRPLFEATAGIVRYGMRLHAYVLMVTSAYPKRLFGDGEMWEAGQGRSATRPLVMSSLGKGLIGLFLLLGFLSGAGSSIGSASGSDDGLWSAPAAK